MPCCSGGTELPTRDPTSFGIGAANFGEEYDLFIKVVIIGDSGVGKSAMLIRLVDDRFTASIGSTIGVDFKSYTMNVNDRHFRVTMWDTAGQERYNTITETYFRGMHVVMLVYDVTNKKSYNNLGNWFTKAQTKNANFEVIVVGCKSDLPPFERNPEVDSAHLTETLGPHQHVTVSARDAAGFKKLTECLATAAQNVLNKKMQEAHDRDKNNKH